MTAIFHLASQKYDVLLFTMGKASKKRKPNHTACAVKEKLPAPAADNAGAVVLVRHIFNLLPVITPGLIVYANTLNSPFPFDDQP